jgi:hypothetical protein
MEGTAMLPRRVLLAMFAVLSFCPCTYPQDNTEVRCRVSADGYYLNGNIKRWYANTRLTTTFSSNTIMFTVTPSLLYGQSGKIITDRHMLTTASLHIFPRNLFFWYGVATYDFSRRNKIESRWQSGAGIGINTVQEPQHGISVTQALVYENTHFNVVEGNETVRMSWRLKGFHELFERSVIVNHETYFQPSVEQFTDLRWRTTVSLDFPVTRALSFRTAVDNNHESVVLTGRKKDDIRWTFGVAVGN